MIGWPTDRPVLAAKRLPGFSDAGSVDAYAALVAGYARALRERGVEVLPTQCAR